MRPQFFHRIEQAGEASVRRRGLAAELRLHFRGDFLELVSFRMGQTLLLVLCAQVREVHHGGADHEVVDGPHAAAFAGAGSAPPRLTKPVRAGRLKDRGKSLIAPQAAAARLPRPLPPLSAVRLALRPSRARRAFLGSGIAKRTASGLQLERQPVAASRQGRGSRNSNHRDRESFERCSRETSRTPSAPSPPAAGNETTPLC